MLFKISGLRAIIRVHLTYCATAQRGYVIYLTWVVEEERALLSLYDLYACLLVNHSNGQRKWG